MVDGALARGVDEARVAFDARRWSDALEAFGQADAASGLDREDLDRYGEAAWWTGQLNTAIAVRERAYAAHVAAGDPLRAASAALSVAADHSHKLQNSLAGGWVKRAERLLADLPEAPVHGYLARAHVAGALGAGDLDEALRQAESVLAIGVRTKDADIEALGLQDKGRVLVAKGEVAEGLALLDEAIVAAVGGDLNPYPTAIVYCNATVACQDLADYRRAVEFAEAARQWCDRQAISGFPGMCRVRRAEVTRLRGSWAEAESEARQACVELQDFCLDYAGEGFYQIGEIRLRMGDLDAAQEAFRQAHELGRNPLPGLALLRLAQGKATAGLAMLSRALDDPTVTPLARARILGAYVELASGGDALDDAGERAQELGKLADRFGTHALLATAAMASGQVALARSDAAAAESHLERARRLWQETDAPYETARARELLGRSHDMAGDSDAAGLEVKAAVAAYRKLGATPDAERAEAILRRLAMALPSRPVTRTMMFTDIVRSTELIEAIGDDAWTRLLQWHDRTIRKLIAENQGEEIHHAGDGFFVAFEDADLALDCAVSIQRQLREHRQEHGFAPSVRIGLHVGDVAQQGASYEGRAVHLAARIGALAGTDEILASREVFEAASRPFVHGPEREVQLKGLRDVVPVAVVLDAAGR
ncbi:MAG: adenylate/guanylate cyclase domain-containing protein [Candidatus Limnocylindria bacterium]